ncbi:hypothetical protein B0A55_06648 [Friedmanniomyces simplex]|uniref:Cytochrome P450 52A13 n=1 Tax=Friedmanniomyces simplex TaxID=329884 RepID=A0A4U0XE60_9PEZI|nr:hypothetical protein B0A55_06648 [Friedmanniomyces simplex]
MHYSVLLPVWGLVALVLYKVVSMVVESQRQAAKAKQLNCQDAPMLPELGFLGYKGVQQMMKADKENLFPDMLVDRHNKMSELTGRPCSTYQFHTLGQSQYFTSDPKNIQHMLAHQFADYDLGPARRGNMIRTLGDGIFVQDGAAWEHSRALLRPNFVREQISDLDMEERHVQNLIRVLPVQSDGWTAETDIQTLFFRLTIDAATEFLFGDSVDSQIAESKTDSGGKKDELAFSQNFDSAQKHMAFGFRLADLFWIYNPKSYKENNKVVNDFVKHYVDLALEKGSREKKAEQGHRRYVFLEALAEQTQDPVELRAQLLNILLAGRDTTASLLSWLFNQLLRNPHVFAQLRATILDTFGTYDDPRDISFATLKGCQYLQACLNETNRLWSIVPGNARRSNKDTTLPRGGGPDGQSPIFIPAQTDVNYSIHVMHRRKDLWGEDAEEFKPERWSGRKPGWEYLPFNGGPRICIGQQFALTEASYVTVRLLQRFDEIRAGAHELEGRITSNLTLTSCPGRPVTLKMHEARD